MRPDVKVVILGDLAVHGQSTAAQVAERTGAHRATVRNNLLAMARPLLGWVVKVEFGEYRCEWKIGDPGREALAVAQKETTP